MIWFYLAIGVLVSAELFLQLPEQRSLNGLKKTAQKTLSTIMSPNISDHWKEVALPRYALQIFASSLISFLLLIVALLPLVIMSLILERAEINIMQLAVSIKGIVFATSICMIYLLIRRRVG